TILAGCSNNDTELKNAPQADMVEVSITASGGGAEDPTRVSFDDRSMIWQSGDEVSSVIASQSAIPATLTAITGGSSATTLTGIIPRPADTDDYYAVYPSNAVVATSSSGQIVTLEIPATQGETTKPLLTAGCRQCSLSDLELNFTPATAILDITVSQPVISVLFEASNGEAVAGEFSYDISRNAVYDITTLSTSSIEYLGGSGQSRIKMLVPARSLSQGYKLTLTDTAGGKMVQSFGYRSGLTLNAGKAYPVNIDFVPVSITMGELQTSYSKYLSHDLTAANDFGKRLTIDGTDAVIAGASSTMIEEAGYYIGDEKHAITSGSKTFAIPDITVSAQGNHSVCAYAVINGQEYRSAAQECIITGLPINGTPKSGEWNKSTGLAYVNFNDTYVRMGNNATSDQYLSKNFNIPNDVDVSTTTSFKVRTYRPLFITYRSTVTAKLSDATLFTQAGPSGNSTAEQDYTISKDATLTASAPTFRIDNSGGRAGSYADIYTVEITYR
ncbi:MAG: fimbrillin family protein, partial [Alistipes sp.]|nr:fimbrillin family protein [Alistipes sp.]